MKVDRHQKRLNAITETYRRFDTECSCCGDEYKKENMFVVDRWGVNKTVKRFYYCKHCVPTKEDVLNLIDTGGGFGIAFVDDFPYYPERRFDPGKPPKQPGETEDNDIPKVYHPQGVFF